MKLTEKTVTREVLEALAVDGIIYLVQINTTKAGYHYISGFNSKEQAKMYRALLKGRNYEYGYFSANCMTVEEAYSNTYIEANTTFTPVTQYRISKNDNVKYTHPEHTSRTLLKLANELLAAKQC